MTISTENRVAGPYAGAGVTSTYGFAFKVFAVSDLVVTKTVSSVDTTLAYGSDYSVSLNADQDANPGGTITYCVAGVPTNLPVGTNLTITTSIPYTQNTQLTNGGGWYPKVVEYALDRLVAIVQQLKNIGDRALKLPITVTGVSTALPVPSAGKLIGWDSLGTSIENKDPSSIAAGVIYGTGKADLFSGNGVTTAFALTANPGAAANLDVAISGVTQRPGIDFTWTTGTTLTFTSPPPAGTNNILARYVQAIPTTGALQISANLSDVQDKPTARSNLGLTSAATTAVGTAAGNLVALDGSAKLPAVDGSALINLPSNGIATGQGQLNYVSAAVLRLSPFNGNKLIVNGTLCTIPDGGVAMSGPAAANTTYYIYATQSGGTINAIEASTTAYAVSTASGNKGVKIKNGDDTRTLVGIARSNGSTQWAANLTRSYYNRTPLVAYNAFSSPPPTTSSGTNVDLDSTKHAEFVCWSDDPVRVTVNGYCFNNSGAYVFTGAGFDGSGPIDYSIVFGTNGGPCGYAVNTTLADGFHYSAIMGSVSGGTGTWGIASGTQVSIRAMVG